MRAAAGAYQLASLEGDSRALVARDLNVAAQKIRSGNHPESGLLQLPQRRLVARIGGDYAGPDRREVAPRRPLLSALHDPPRAATENRLHWHAAVLEGGEQVRLLLHPRLTLRPVQNRQTIRSDEMRRIHHAQIPVDVGEYHVE